MFNLTDVSWAVIQQNIAEKWSHHSVIDFLKKNSEASMATWSQTCTQLWWAASSDFCDTGLKKLNHVQFPHTGAGLDTLKKHPSLPSAHTCLPLHTREPWPGIAPRVIYPKNGGFQSESPFPVVYFQGLC